MQILLTFDVEIWCAHWDRIEHQFPAAFDRYVNGGSAAGEFALPKTLEILGRHHLHGIFFVECLFAARFGIDYLRRIVELIQGAGHEVQLHLHTEWTDEIVPSPVPAIPGKRQHLRQYSLEDQTRLIALGIELQQAAGAARPIAFRAGNMAANSDTFRALHVNGIRIDSSIDATVRDSASDIRQQADVYRPSYIDNVASYPIGVFRDGWGRERHAQVGACAVEELFQAIESADRLGWRQFVLLSHNFEMLQRRGHHPDRFVVRRFERLALFLERNATRYPCVRVSELSAPRSIGTGSLPRASHAAVWRRTAEQALRTAFYSMATVTITVLEAVSMPETVSLFPALSVV